jgi:hypothetical protein
MVDEDHKIKRSNIKMEYKDGVWHTQERFIWELILKGGDAYSRSLETKCKQTQFHSLH